MIKPLLDYVLLEKLPSEKKVGSIYLASEKKAGNIATVVAVSSSKDKDGKDKVNMLEINTTPGMTVTSFIPQQVRAAGLDIKDVLSEIVENQF